jgi:hypothetical protein
VDDWPGMLQWRLLVGSPIVMGKVSRLLPSPKTSRRFFGVILLYQVVLGLMNLESVTYKDSQLREPSPCLWQG